MQEESMRVCPRCGRNLPMSEFYHMKGNRIETYCKECARARYREYYARSKKKPSYVFKRPDGILIQIDGKTHRIYWSGNMLSMLRKYYPVTKNAEMVEMLGVSQCVIRRKANELGLSKAKEFLDSIRAETAFCSRYKKKK